MLSSSSSTSISTTFLCLLAASLCFLSFVGAETEITTDYLYKKISPTAALPGFNIEGGSVFENYVNALRNKQLFWNVAMNSLYENPPNPVTINIFQWCSDLTFSDVNNSSLIGFSGRCVRMVLLGYAEAAASGTTFDYSVGDITLESGMSAVFVEQLNVFEGQVHADTDGFMFRHWDDGRKTIPALAWEGGDEGDAVLIDIQARSLPFLK